MVGFLITAGFVTNSVLGMIINIFTMANLVSSNILSIIKSIHRYTGLIFFILGFSNIIGGWDNFGNQTATIVTSIFIGLASITYITLLISGYQYNNKR